MMTLSELIEETFNLPASEQTDTTQFSKLEDWDSMAHMLFITQLEENFEVEFTGNEIAAIQTIGDVEKLLESKKK